MFEQVIKSVQAQISERTASPLMGSFLLSWCLWNYKFLVILFSSASVSRTFDLIETVAFPNLSVILLKGVLLPAMTAAAYIFLYPYPAKYVYEFSRMRQKEINDIKRRIEEETPLTIEESRKIRAELARIEAEHSEQRDRKDREIERLKAQLNPPRAEDGNRGLVDEPSEEVRSIEPSQLFMLRLVEKLKGRAPEKTLLQRSTQSQVKTEFDLGELVQQSLLKRNYRGDAQDYVYEFTQAGRSYLLAHADELHDRKQEV